MKAVMPAVPEFILEWRRLSGADRRDEMWDGVLHMSPEADREHQDVEGALETWLRIHWSKPRRAKVFHRINVSTADAGGNWTNNFRIPDLVLLLSDRFHIDKRTYFAGGPNVVVEIRSPDDESEEKLPFYADVGVQEVWIIDRDTKQPVIYVLSGEAYTQRPADADGWLRSPLTEVELRIGRPGKLALRLNGDDSTREEIPED